MLIGIRSMNPKAVIAEDKYRVLKGRKERLVAIKATTIAVNNRLVEYR